MALFQDLVLLIARIFLSSFFLWEGGSQVWHWKSSVEYLKSKKMPSSLIPAAVILQLVGGLSVLLGYQARVGTVLLIVFIIPAAIKMYDFWKASDLEKTSQKTLFMKDVAILGGLLLLLATGAGRFALN
ncbi:MAG: DoxX family protein [Verrucomicrobia bacterium]|nr:DoxX family protein [Verrucomicrobiota bacterium]